MSKSRKNDTKEKNTSKFPKKGRLINLLKLLPLEKGQYVSTSAGGDR